MNTLVFFLVVLALGSASPIGSSTAEPSREDRIQTAIDKNVQWLLSNIRNGCLNRPNLARAVVAIFLAEPGYFSTGHEIGQELKNNITDSFLRLVFGWDRRPPTSEELDLYVQAVTVLCKNPNNFFGHDLVNEIWMSGVRSQQNGRFPSSSFLALCNAGATHVLTFLSAAPFKSVHLSDEEAFTPMSIDCFESHFPWNYPELKRLGFIRKSGYQYYPSNLTVEDLQELINPQDDALTNPTPLSAIAATMQTLMHIRQLRLSDLPSAAVDFLLSSQDADGSWGKSVRNSYFVLPVLSDRSFLNIKRDHCPSYRTLQLLYS